MQNRRVPLNREGSILLLWFLALDKPFPFQVYLSVLRPRALKGFRPLRSGKPWGSLFGLRKPFLLLELSPKGVWASKGRICLVTVGNRLVDQVSHQSSQVLLSIL